MKGLLLFIALLIIGCGPAAGQIKPLVQSDTIATTLTFDGNRSFALPTACDDKGRSYVKLMEPDGKMTGPVFRVSPKGVIEAQFDITGTLGNTFAVRPNSGIAVAHLDGKAKVIDQFGPDGARESQVRLEVPPAPFFPMQIAVFPSGGIFLAGPQYRPAEKPSAAVYNAEGHLLKQLDLERTEEQSQAINVSRDKFAAASKLAGHSVAITGDDGYVYFMRADSPPSVYVISSDGEIVRKLVVNGPTGRNWPRFGLRVAKNRLLVEFYRECQNPVEISSCQGRLYTIVDATSGERLADFEPDQTTIMGPVACYVPDPDRLSTFSIEPERHRLDIVETVPR